MKPTVIFDFDGVIHSYKSGWKGATVIPDLPVPNIKAIIQEIRQHYRVVVVSTRCFQEGGIQAIKDYLEFHSIEVDDVTAEKPPAIVSIDDRAITFNGDEMTSSKILLNMIQNFKPWNEKHKNIGKLARLGDVWYQIMDVRTVKGKTEYLLYSKPNWVEGKWVDEKWVEDIKEVGGSINGRIKHILS